MSARELTRSELREASGRLMVENGKLRGRIARLEKAVRGLVGAWDRYYAAKGDPEEREAQEALDAAQEAAREALGETTEGGG